MLVLECSAAPVKSFQPSGFDQAALKAGRVVDYGALQPGDLILSRDEKPDWVSNGIAAVQAIGELDKAEARFTHTMMYLGAGFVLEATFEFKKPGIRYVAILGIVASFFGVHESRTVLASTPLDTRKKLHGVFVTPLSSYSEHYSLCARRPVALANNPAAQLEMISNAIALFSKDYDFTMTRDMLLLKCLPSKLLNREWTPEVRTAAVVCSTFYARAFDATVLGEGITFDSGCCLPLSLARSSAFVDVPLQWASVG